MSNSKLIDKIYPVPPYLQNFLGKTISYHTLKTKKSKMNQSKQDDLTKFNSEGGDNVLKWVEETLKKDRDAIHNLKQTGMKAGRENQFIRKHEKDNHNANPTAVGGVPKITKGSVNRKIIDNKEVYNESIKKEISEIKYLIEYMNNKKQNL